MSDRTNLLYLVTLLLRVGVRPWYFGVMVKIRWPTFFLKGFYHRNNIKLIFFNFGHFSGIAGPLLVLSPLRPQNFQKYIYYSNIVISYII